MIEIKGLDILPYYKELLNSKKNYSVINHNNKTYILTKEYSCFEVDDLEKFEADFKNDEFYSTDFVDGKISELVTSEDLLVYNHLLKRYKTYFIPNELGLIFGCLAVRGKDCYITTTRGKKDLLSMCFVKSVDHENRKIQVLKQAVNTFEKEEKSTLNMPLLDYIFKTNPGVKAIIHYHSDKSVGPTLPYAFPGTVRDSIRNINTNFEIEHHGQFILIR